MKYRILKITGGLFNGVWRIHTDPPTPQARFQKAYTVITAKDELDAYKKFIELYGATHDD